ncbi:MAG: dTMP kinase [Gammaproteobacteria bacterium]|nr:dTMP kinase [Gammaproteobacteria bacterium]
MGSDRKGFFVTFEGIEGVGKSTQIELIAQALMGDGRLVVKTREPGGTPAGEAIREILLHRDSIPIDNDTELLLIFASRAQHLAQVVRPALAAGRIVLCDRFTDATYAYQGGGRGVLHSRIAALEAYVQDGLRPDLTLLLDAPVAVGMERARTRRDIADRFEREHAEFFERVRTAYLEIARADSDRVVLLDGRGAAESIHEQVLSCVRRRLPR